MSQVPNVLGERLFQLSREQLTMLAETLCSELTARGDYYGGVRPDNIGYTEDGNVVLGSAAAAEGGEQDTAELEYMAPEVFWSGVQSPAADVYSIGLLLYAGVSNGLLPFYPPNPTPSDRADALKRRMNGEALPMPRSAGKELSEIIRKATAFRSADRYPTTEALREVLMQYRADLRASVPTAKEMFDKPEQELSEVERMMLNILAERAVDVGESEVVDETPGEPDIEVEVVETEPETQPVPPEVEEAAAAIERRQSKPQETIIVVPHPKAELPEDAPAAQSAPAPAPAPALRKPAAPKAEPQRDQRPADAPAKRKAVEPLAQRKGATTPPPRKRVPPQPEKAAVQHKRKAAAAAAEQKKESKKHVGQIIAIVALVLVAAALLALILNQLGYIRLGGDGGDDAVIANTPEVEDTTETPEPTATPEPEPEPTETPEPEPTPTPVPTSTYEIVMSNASWEQAKAEAEAKGGHLVVIDSAEELQTVTQMAAGSGAEYVWLGLFRQANGELAWVVPSETPVYNWAQGEPSVMDASTGAPENYVLVRNYGGAWYYNDIMNDPVTNYPAIFGGRVAYVIEYQE